MMSMGFIDQIMGAMGMEAAQTVIRGTYEQRGSATHRGNQDR